jgi:hypothetical protein
MLTDNPCMATTMVRAVFAGDCALCRRSYRKNDLVFPSKGRWICVPCQREVDRRPR